MTTEEAIQWMQEMKIGGKIMGSSGIVDACDMAIAALRAQQERETPKPLTLEELMEMEGEPVWVQSPGMPEYGRWAIVEGVDIEPKTLYLLADYTCHDYGKVWLAYRHKPKEGI